MSLAEFIGVVLKWKWIVIPIIIVVTGYTIITSTRSQTSYEAEVMVIPGLSRMVASSIEGSGSAGVREAISVSLSELLYTEPVMEKALEKSGSDISIRALKGKVSVETAKDTPIFRIIVTDREPETAQVLADAVAESLIEYTQEASNNDIEANRSVISGELAVIEAQLASAESEGSIDEGEIQGLQSMRSLLLQEYQLLVTGLVAAGDIQVEKAAVSYQAIGTPVTTRVMVAFIISLVAAITIAFVAEGASKAIRRGE